MSDWQVGDLAAHDDKLPYCRICAAEADLDVNGWDALDTVQRVMAVLWSRGEDYPGLVLSGDSPGDLPWCACQYRKVCADRHEACEAEFIALLQRTKRKADA